MASINKIPPDHPVLNPLDLQLRTPEIERLHKTITQWLWTGATGGLIQGAARVGKTTGLEILANALITRNGAKVPVHHFTVPRRDRRTINAVYRNLCISSGFAISKRSRTNTDELLDTFLHYLMDQAVEENSKRIVLFVDEMQRLSIDQLDVFAELYDILRKFKYALMVIFTGNDCESDHLLKAIERHERKHLLGRFFEQRTYFHGITTLTEIRFSLNQYDTLRHPAPKGPTYTECFLPAAYSNGWRLHHLAEDIWRIYREYKQDLKLSAWAMQYFVSATNVLLIDYLPRYGIDNFSDDMMHECIKVSGLIPSLVEIT